MKVIRKIEPTLLSYQKEKRWQPMPESPKKKVEPFIPCLPRLVTTVPKSKRIKNGSMQEFMQMKVLLGQHTKEVNFKE